MASNIKVTELDFDSIKDNLKAYLKGQDTFKDFDFEGSGMNILLDVLAYNTHYQSVYVNMAVNEAFLDTSVKRNSAVSLAKHLGYVPKSKFAPSAIINVNFGVERPSVETLDRGQRFVIKFNDEVLSFVTLDSYVVKRNQDSEYIVEDVVVYEGTIASNSFIVNSQDSSQKFVIPSENIDTRSIQVKIVDSINKLNGFFDTWTRVEDINYVDSTSKVYWIQENEDGYYEVYFGDGIVGKRPQNGNVVIVTYLNTNGSSYNDAAKNGESFVYVGEDLATVTLVDENSYVSGGADKESIESIKFYAPKSYQAQSRAVTALDYQTIIAKEYANAESVFVWGGEDNDPPEYGKIFISVKPNNSNDLTFSEKETIRTSILKRRSIVGVIPEFVDPDVTYLLINSTVKYNPRKTAQKSGDLMKVVESAIKTYSNTELEKFERNFNYSKFIGIIDDVDVAVNSNLTTVSMQKRQKPTPNVNQIIDFDFGNSLKLDSESILSSNSFVMYDEDTLQNQTMYLDDNNGILRFYRLINQTDKVFSSKNAGTIDYETGKISIKNFNPVSVDFDELRITVIPREYDISTKRNQILQIDNDDSLLESIVIDMVPQVVDTNNSAFGISFPFTNKKTNK